MNYCYVIKKFSSKKNVWIEVGRFKNKKMAIERYELYKKNTNEQVIIQLAFGF